MGDTYVSPREDREAARRGEVRSFLCRLSETPEMTGGLFEILIYSDDDYFVGKIQI